MIYNANPLKVSRIEEDKNYKLFDDNFPFYDEDLREVFISKFYDRYRNRRIGFETLGRFKKALNSRLRLIMPYYKQLYFTEVEASKCNFMLNKDLKETFIREITGENFVQSESRSNASGESSSNSEGKFLDTPVSKLGTEQLDDYLTNAQKDKMNSTSSTNGVNNSNTTGNNNQSEKTELLSQGNIGITSSGQLLEDWRRILINIDMMILDELNDLFFGLY